MDSVVDFLLPYVLTYKYVALFAITFLGAVLLPLPSGTIIAAATAFATQGYMNPWGVFLTGVIGNFVGDNTGYWIARKYGVPTLERLGFHKLLTSERFQVVEQQVAHHPLLTVFWSRFMTAIAPTVNIIAGLARMRYRTYLFFEFTGEVAEVGLNFGIGYFFGANWEYFSQYLNNIWMVMIAGLALSYLVWKGMERRHRKRVQQSKHT